jgi:hypothetical protein
MDTTLSLHAGSSRNRSLASMDQRNLNTGKTGTESEGSMRSTVEPDEEDAAGAVTAADQDEAAEVAAADATAEAVGDRM